MGERGHSLVELVVAMLLVLCVAAGLLRFLGACLGSATRTVEGVELRRNLRRALEQVSDDLQEAGFQVPCRASPGGPGLTSGPSALVLVKDRVLPGRGRLCAPLPVGDPAPLSRRVRVGADRRVRLQAGDVLLVEDGAWEGLRLTGPLVLEAGREGEGIVEALEGEVPRTHGEGVGVAFLRPSCRVAYRLEGGRLVRRCGEDTPRVLADRLVAFRVDPGRPPAVAVTLEALGPAGGRCALTLARVPRNGGPP
ncbi:PilW family protein [Mesoterricola silvestris]|uniref:Prepilin-type N-terminal cleavage/methylation domain-containing protein n=1 Tax=Mesoterricola silvestris TaxID=2927979 RepID=A0AA48GWX2_9BACT|nr:hypothetical protein [Mesoterricola silvestris]BDU73366.1 hypothetical protein METEAL_25400 [Mesoterricola silvestris]